MAGGALTISALARRYGLARSTLLHYDRIGLLRPAVRTDAGYRLYGAQEQARMERIHALRAAGLPLAEVAAVLDHVSPLAGALEKQLAALQEQMDALRAQQGVLLAMLGKAPGHALDKAGWTALFRSIGMSEDDMRRWHMEFERQRPEAHLEFLRSLRLDDAEIARIRSWR